MCGRYNLIHGDEYLRARIPDLVLEVDEIQRRYNVAPTQQMPVIAARSGQTVLTAMRWGLVPHWAQDPTIGSRMINARAETLAEKPAFRQALARRRCLVPASGYYEWTGPKTNRQPYHIRRSDQELLLMAGLWEVWSRGGTPLQTYTVITTEANTQLAPLHHRMPVLLTPEAARAWLNPRTAAPAALELLRPCPDDLLEAYPVAAEVGKPGWDSPECLAPLPE